MTREALKAAIRRGDPTPGVDQTLFESVYIELLNETHPGSEVKTLQESRGSSDGLPAGIHERVAAMLDASKAKRAVAQLSEARSDLKSDEFFDPPGRDNDTVGRIFRAAAERYKQSNHPDAIRARALTLDNVGFGRPEPWRLSPARTLSEAKAEAERIPEGIHQVIYNRLRGA